MFHISRAICFIACLAAAVFFDITIGAIGMIACTVVIPNPARRAK